MSKIREKMEGFNKRWNIKSEVDSAKAFQTFKTRVMNLLKDIDNRVSHEGIIDFCNRLQPARTVHWKYNPQGVDISDNLLDAFHHQEDSIEFYRMIENLFDIEFKTPDSFEEINKPFKDYYYEIIKGVIDYSDINLSIIKNGNEVILFPKGEEKLDDNLVNEVLSFLNLESNNHFVSALKLYEKGSSVKSAESLRRSLEEFIKFKLKNDKGLDANISELLKKLKGDKREPQVRNIIFSTLNYLDTYFNENSKHKDGDIDEAENEYLIYQIGVLMRYVNKVI